MGRFLTLAVLLAVFSSCGAHAQQKQDARAEIYPKRCIPKVQRYPPRTHEERIRPIPQPKCPVISYQILESGQVMEARVERSSGNADLDKLAVDWISGTEYKARPGCGVVESNACVQVHWESGK